MKTFIRLISIVIGWELLKRSKNPKCKKIVQTLMPIEKFLVFMYNKFLTKGNK